MVIFLSVLSSAVKGENSKNALMCSYAVEPVATVYKAVHIAVSLAPRVCSALLRVPVYMLCAFKCVCVCVCACLGVSVYGCVHVLACAKACVHVSACASVRECACAYACIQHIINGILCGEPVAPRVQRKAFAGFHSMRYV